MGDADQVIIGVAPAGFDTTVGSVRVKGVPI